MPIYSAWDGGPEDGITFIEGAGPPRYANGDPDPCTNLVATFEAVDWNDACRQYHEFMGWEPYQPMVSSP